MFLEIIYEWGMSKEANLVKTAIISCYYLFIFNSQATSNKDITLDNVGLQKSKIVFLLNSVKSNRYIHNVKEMENFYFINVDKKDWSK